MAGLDRPMLDQGRAKFQHQLDKTAACGSAMVAVLPSYADQRFKPAAMARAGKGPRSRWASSAQAGAGVRLGAVRRSAVPSCWACWLGTDRVPSCQTGWSTQLPGEVVIRLSTPAGS
jgi:hypothetical protein